MSVRAVTEKENVLGAVAKELAAVVTSFSLSRPESFLPLAVRLVPGLVGLRKQTRKPPSAAVLRAEPPREGHCPQRCWVAGAGHAQVRSWPRPPSELCASGRAPVLQS